MPDKETLKLSSCNFKAISWIKQPLTANMGWTPQVSLEGSWEYDIDPSKKKSPSKTLSYYNLVVSMVPTLHAVKNGMYIAY